jgi:Ala-tRNA(Pro) deacylase
MSLAKNIRDYLEKNHVTYWRKIHPVAYTAQELAQMDHVPGRDIAKTVVLKSDGRFMLAVLPADLEINMAILKRKLGSLNLMLATEEEFAPLFPQSQKGAMPPFGGLYGLPVFCDRTLASRREIEFNAGTHVDTLRMTFEEFEVLERPIILDFAEGFVRSRLARSA